MTVTLTCQMRFTAVFKNKQFWGEPNSNQMGYTTYPKHKRSANIGPKHIMGISLYLYSVYHKISLYIKTYISQDTFARKRDQTAKPKTSPTKIESQVQMTHRCKLCDQTEALLFTWGAKRFMHHACPMGCHMHLKPENHHIHMVPKSSKN